MVYQNTERRRQRRVKAKLPIGIIYNQSEVRAQTKNISLLGTYVETDQKIAPGTKIDIELEIPAYTRDRPVAETIRCEGVIFRCNLVSETEPERCYGLGIFFRSFLKKRDKEKLASYIDYLLLREEVELKRYIKTRKRFVKDKARRIKRKGVIRSQSKDKDSKLQRTKLRPWKGKDLRE